MKLDDDGALHMASTEFGISVLASQLIAVCYLFKLKPPRRFQGITLSRNFHSNQSKFKLGTEVITNKNDNGLTPIAKINV